MWIDFENRTVDLEKLLTETMNSVLYRQQNYVYGLRIQLSLCHDEMNSAIKNTLLKSFISLIKVPAIMLKVQEATQKFKAGNELHSEELINYVVDFIISSQGKYVKFMGVNIDKKKLNENLRKPIIECIEQSDTNALSFINNLVEAVKEQLSPVNLLYSGRKPSDFSKKEMQEYWQYLFGGRDKTYTVQGDLLKESKLENLHSFYKKAKKNYSFQDIIRLQLLESFSYQQAIIDAVISFENWLSEYVRYLVYNDPGRALNIKGIHPRFKNNMIELKTEYDLLSSNFNETVIKKIIDQEILNVGFAGAYLKSYLSQHLNYDISSEHDQLFDEYTDIRNLRNSLVHPKALVESKLTVPCTMEGVEMIVNNLNKLGKVIINACGLVIIKREKGLL